MIWPKPEADLLLTLAASVLRARNAQDPPGISCGDTLRVSPAETLGERQLLHAGVTPRSHWTHRTLRF